MAARPETIRTSSSEPRDVRNITQILKTFGEGPERKLRKFSSVAIAGDGTIFATTAGNDTIFVIDESTSSSFKLDVNSYCFGGMTIVPVPGTTDWNVAISAFSSGAVHLISPDGHAIKKLTSTPLKGPNGLALLGDRLYVCESQANCVSVFSMEGERLLQFGAQGKEDGQFIWPHQICVGPGDLLYVSDMNNNRVQVFEKDGTFVRKFGSDVLVSPIGLRITPSGHVAVVSKNNNSLVFFTTNGRCVHTLPTSIGLCQPCGLDIDKEGFLYVADSDNGRIVKL